MVNKLPDVYECPVDVWLLKFIDTHLAWYYVNGFTPNLVTTISILIGMLSALAVYYQQFAVGAALFIIAYYLDCVDGKLARKYNMVTAFGDFYDHFGDVLKFALVAYALYHNNNKKLSVSQHTYKTIVTVLTCFLFLQIGYQETLYNQSDSTTLSLFRSLVSIDSQPERSIQLTKYLGQGTFVVLFSAIIILWDKYK